MSAGRRRRAAKVDLEAWNAAHPVGTLVAYWPGIREGEPRQGKLRSPATRLWAKGHPVVWIEGHAGCVALSHVDVIA